MIGMDGSGGGGDSNPRPFKKKNKKSYLQKMKKFGKKGQFGKGREIDKDTYDYFVRVLENLSKDEFEDDEAKGRPCSLSRFRKR